MLRHNAQSIGEILRQYLKMTQLENQIFEGHIASIWQETLGDQITLMTDRIHLEAGVLYVQLKSPSLRNDLLMQRTRIRMALNEKLGSDVIKSVVLR